MTSPNGFTYATFPDPATGFSALVDYVSRHIQSGISNLTGINKLFGNSPSYLNSLSTGSGLSPTQTLTTADAASVARGIAVAEGTASIVPGVGSVGATATPKVTSPDFWTQLLTGAANAADYPAGFLTGLFGGNTTPTPAQGPNNPGAASGAATGQGVAQTAAGQGGPWSFGNINWEVVAVIGAAALFGLFAISAAFSGGSHGGGTTKIVPIPV